MYGYVINNISIAIEAGKPQLEKYNEKIQKSLSKSLHLSQEQVGLAFTRLSENIKKLKALRHMTLVMLNVLFLSRKNTYYTNKQMTL